MPGESDLTDDQGGNDEFRVEPRGIEDGVATVAVSGEVDVATAPLLRAGLHSVVDEGAGRLRIDLTEVTFIDSAGLGVLIGILKRLRENGGTVELAQLQPGPRKVVEITGLDDLFVIVD
jgi:anti-sigma B factor antagonist